MSYDITAWEAEEMEEKTIKEIMAKVMANRKKLDNCKRHHFSDTKAEVGKKVACDNCQGEMGLVEVGAYIAGFVAAGGNEDDIWPSYSKRWARWVR